jgi:pyruvate-ferredoxin/flavodoxin oxidoreductase
VPCRRATGIFTDTTQEQGKAVYARFERADVSFDEFLDGEVRYASLKKNIPKNAEELFAAAKKEAKEK